MADRQQQQRQDDLGPPPDPVIEVPPPSVIKVLGNADVIQSGQTEEESFCDPTNLQAKIHKHVAFVAEVQIQLVSSDALGTDLEHVDVMQRKFDEFLKALKSHEANIMIDKGHPEQQQIPGKRDEMNEAWHKLGTLTSTRSEAVKMDEAKGRCEALKLGAEQSKQGLDRSYNRHRHCFMADYRELCAWNKGIEALIQSSELAKDVAGAEALLEQHQEHKGEIEARADSFKQTAETGQRLLEEEGIHNADEIRQCLQHLSVEQASLNSLWEQRRMQCMGLQLFYRDTELAKSWVTSQKDHLYQLPLLKAPKCFLHNISMALIMQLLIMATVSAHIRPTDTGKYLGDDAKEVAATSLILKRLRVEEESHTSAARHYKRLRLNIEKAVAIRPEKEGPVEAYFRSGSNQGTTQLCLCNITSAAIQEGVKAALATSIGIPFELFCLSLPLTTSQITMDECQKIMTTFYETSLLTSLELTTSDILCDMSTNCVLQETFNKTAPIGCDFCLLLYKKANKIARTFAQLIKTIGIFCARIQNQKDIEKCENRVNDMTRNLENMLKPMFNEPIAYLGCKHIFLCND